MGLLLLLKAKPLLGFCKLEPVAREVCKGVMSKGVMSKAKWFAVCGKKPSKGEIIATSANQIVPKFPDLSSYRTMLKGGLGTRLGTSLLIL